MKFYRINNIKNLLGEIDYKGLDISKFVTGSQVYAKELAYCFIATVEDTVIEQKDLIELNKEEFVEQRNTLLQELEQEEKLLMIDKKIESFD